MLRTSIGVQPIADLLSDERLLFHGDAESFAKVYDRHVRQVFVHCARQLGSGDRADDATAVVFLEAWRRRDDIRLVSGSALPWLLMTGTNVCRNLDRSARRHRRALQRLPPPVPDPDHSQSVTDAQAFATAHEPLTQALGTLSDTDRQVVSLCLISGLKYAEAADVLGLSYGAVRSRLSRARSQLREALRAAGITSIDAVEGDHHV